MWLLLVRQLALPCNPRLEVTAGLRPLRCIRSLPAEPTAGAAGECYRSTIRLVMRRRYHPEVTNGSGTAKDSRSARDRAAARRLRVRARRRLAGDDVRHVFATSALRTRREGVIAGRCRTRRSR